MAGYLYVIEAKEDCGTINLFEVKFFNSCLLVICVWLISELSTSWLSFEALIGYFWIGFTWSAKSYTTGC